MVLTGLEAFVIRAFCSWCLVQAAASLGLLVAAVMLLRTPANRWRRIPAGRASGPPGSGKATGRACCASGGPAAAWQPWRWPPSWRWAPPAAAPTVSPGPSGLVGAGSPRLGSGPIEVVEFADFQCPGCAALAPILAQLASANEMTLVSRYFPLDANHANADRSARAAAAAHEQGAFWEMSDALYARQGSWKDLPATDADAFFMTLAGELGLDTAEWQAAYESPEIAAVVDVDRQAASTLGLNSTPTLFIGGTHYTGPLSADGIRAAIAAAS